MKDVEILSKTASLLIHAAKMDENYTGKEKSIIEKLYFIIFVILKKKPTRLRGWV